MPEIVVHHLEKSRSHRVLWLLEELGVPYEMITYKRVKRRAPPEMKAIHPLGRSPIVVIDGVPFVESAHVLEALLDAVGDQGLRPEPGTQAAVDYRFWMHFAEGSLTPPLVMKLLTTAIRTLPFPVNLLMLPAAKGLDGAYIDGEIDNTLGYADSWFADHPFAAGDAFSAADIQLGYPIAAALGGRARKGAYPHLAAYAERMKARPAYAKAIEIGGPLV